MPTTTDIAQTAALRRDGEAISRTFAQCEQTCLDVGGRLGAAIPGLNDLAALFATLSQSLEGAEFRAAGSDLQAVADKIRAIADVLSGESKALSDLVDLNKGVAARIANLSADVRTIVALVFNVKIEAASLDDAGDDMTSFADGLQALAQRAQKALEEYQSTHAKLYQLLRSSSEAQTEFEKSHQDKLSSISAEILASLDAVADRRREIAVALSKIGTQSQHIGARVGQGVVALQIGDSTRQRIEHAHAALQLAASGVEEGATSQIWAHLEEVPSQDTRHAVAARICRLQSLQLGGALDDFTREMDTVSALLQGLAEDADGLADRSRTLFGSHNERGDSFLEDLERKLEAACAIVDQCRRARAIVDGATSSVGTTMEDLNERTARLSEIVVDMTIIGMNAVLKSSRLGDRGKGLNVIAQELRSHAIKVVEGIKALPAALRDVVAFVERLSEAGRDHDAAYLTSLKERMMAAIETFKVNAKQMSEAMSRLDDETNVVREMLSEGATKLRDRHDIGATLQEAIASIDVAAPRIGDPDNVDADGASLIDHLLRGSYTMASERQIHDEYIGSAVMLPRSSGDDVEAAA